MKINKITSALIAAGVLSLAGSAQANTIIYLTGSTAARAVIFSALQTPGEVFPGGGTCVSPAPNNVNSGAQFVFEGTNSTLGTVDVDCDFTGSEAGIASVAGTAAQNAFKQSLPGDPNGSGPYAFPGVPPTFLTQGSGWTTSSQNTSPDLAMADTSQAVSQTPKSTYNLTDYGVVGIVPFTFMKGYEATPDSTWSNLVNVTTATINQNLAAGDLYNANNYTGILSDTNDGVAIIGRNLGSGTRADTLLNMQFGLNSPVQQFAYGALTALYPSSAPGTLTFAGSYAANQTLQDIANDGFDSGSGVQKTLNVDSTGQEVVLVGYMGLSDAKHAKNDDNTGAGGSGSAAGSGGASFLSYNGVYESDAGVINGTYTFWGEEHLFGQITPTSAASTFATALKSGIAADLINNHYGTVTGNVTTVTAQSILIPTSLMLVHRGALPGGSDTGFPTQGGF